MKFAAEVRRFVKQTSKTLTNIEDCKQLIRSSGSIGANYIEANEALSRKDFFYRIKICRKEAKETRYWLLLVNARRNVDAMRNDLIQESTELMHIFGAIISRRK